VGRIYHRPPMPLRKRQAQRSLACHTFGVEVEVALDDIELRERVQEILPPGWKPADPRDSTDAGGRFGLRDTGADSYEVTVDDVPWLEHATLEVALGMLDAQIRIYVAANARERIFVHAGVVTRGGMALVIPGESFSGKTTLVSALVRLGATYYSDEYAVLDDEGRVHPYPRPLSIRGEDGTAPQERQVGAALAAPAALAAVVVTRYRPGAEWQPTRLSPGQGVLALLANTVPAQERPQESLRAVSRAVAGAIVLESDRGEARPAAESILEALAAHGGSGRS
jgi:hypothetical protein